jgi:putative exporter of polyketide antibiotics
MRHSRKIGIDPISFAFVALSLLLAACLLVMDNLNEQALIAWNAFVPAVVLLVGTVVSAWLVRANVIYTLSPIPWFYLTSAAYFGLGPLIFTFGTPEAISNLNYSSHYPIEDQGLFEVNLLSVAGILCVTVGIIIGRRLFPWKHYLREWSEKNIDNPTT